MNTCDTCKHWEPPGEDKDHRGMGDCLNLLLQQEGQNSLTAGEVWGQNLMPNTGPKFGCIHHEAKPFIEVLMPNTPENSKLMDGLGFKSNQ